MPNFATSTENTEAANELYSGAKSRMVPVHDSMAGNNGVPVYSDNIEAAAMRQGYPNIQISEGNQPTYLNEI
jgi:hypothetical protein